MNVRRRFAMALAASMLVHLAVLLGPAWTAPALDDGGGSAPPLAARLVEPAIAAAPGPSAIVTAKPLPARKPRPRRVHAPDATPIDRPVATLPAEPEPPAEVPAETLAQAEDTTPAPPVAEAVTGPAEPAGEAAVQSVDLPRAVRIRYAVTMGDNGFVLGQTLQEFRQDGKRYSTRSTATTTGLANLFKPARVTNVSEGEIVQGRLRPREYHAERGKGKSESARFNWEESRVALAEGREFELPSATQDMLSVFFQLALMVPTDQAVLSLPVVTGRKLERYDFEVVGEETIDTHVGRRRTLHLRARPPEGRDSTEVWLSLDAPRLPVRIRHVDRKGDVFEQVADRIDLEPQREETR